MGLSNIPNPASITGPFFILPLGAGVQLFIRDPLLSNWVEAKTNKEMAWKFKPEPICLK